MASISSTPTDNQKGSEDVLFLCSSQAEEQDVAQAVHALYYLPQNYKLVVLEDQTQTHPMSWADESIKGRIEYKTNDKTELSEANQAAPFSFADFIVSDEKSKGIFRACSAPQLRIDQNVSAVAPEKHGFRVPMGNPEALASAIMRLTRA